VPSRGRTVLWVVMLGLIVVLWAVPSPASSLAGEG
jgi:hypothetical protein